MQVIISNYEVYSLKFPTSGNVQLINYSVVNSSSNVKCVRYGNVNVTSSNSSGQSTASSLGDGMPTMISNLSASSMSFMASTFYCGNLVESGYDDWILPTIDQLTYAISGGCNFNDNRDGYTLWTRTPYSYNYLLTLRDSYYNSSIGGNFTAINRTYSEDSYLKHCRWYDNFIYLSMNIKNLL